MTSVPLREYIHTNYRPDCEYIDGQIHERQVGEKDHSKLQRRLTVFFDRLGGVQVWPEQRIQVKPLRFRVPDICVTVGEPEEQIFTPPPLICIEILSPEDTVARLMERIEDYCAFGVPHIWVLDPAARRGYVATRSGLQAAEVLRVSDPPVELRVAQLFE